MPWWLWLLLLLALGGLIWFFIVRNKSAGKWEGLAKAAIAECENLFLKVSADLGRVNIDGVVPATLAESQLQLDMLAGNLAQLARDPGHLTAQAPLATLRDTVDGLRLSLKEFGGAQVNMTETLAKASAGLTAFETAVGHFRDQIEPPPAPQAQDWS